MVCKVMFEEYVPIDSETHDCGDATITFLQDDTPADAAVTVQQFSKEQFPASMSWTLQCEPSFRVGPKSRGNKFCPDQSLGRIPENTAHTACTSVRGDVQYCPYQRQLVRTNSKQELW